MSRSLRGCSEDPCYKRAATANAKPVCAFMIRSPLETCGQYPDVAIEQARGLAAEANAAIARGENPNEKKRAVREEMTLGELFSLYLERHAKVHKRSWRDDQAQFERFLSSFEDENVETLARRRVDILKGREGATGHFYINWNFNKMDFSEY